VIEKAITVDENESCHFPDFEPLQTKNKCVVLKHLGEESLTWNEKKSHASKLQKREELK